ncbi:MAG: hypothetical protein DELT_02917 [Desulfovibrio sp.]
MMRSKIVVLLASAVSVAVSVVVLTAAFGTDAAAARRSVERSQKREQPVEVPLTVATFAHKLTLDGDSGAVLSYQLTEPVYTGLARQDFSDLCVFDVEGNPVPFQVRSPKSASANLVTEKEVPYFVWQPETTGKETPASIDIEINAKGGIVHIKGQTEGVARPGPVSFLLDLQEYYDAMQNPVSQSGETFGPENVRRRSVEVNLAGDNTFIAYVSMKTSADLATWSPVGKPQVLARMLTNDVTLVRDTLELPATAKRYLLLELSDSEAPVLAFTAKAEYGKTTASGRETLFSGTVSEDKRSVSYTVPGRFPVTAVGFDLPQPDMMAVRLMGSDDPQTVGSQFASGFIYRLDKDGSAITGEPFPVKYARRHWTLRAAGDIPFAAAPALRLFWEPREVLFLARGKGPWTLAYGREAGVRSVASPMLDQATVVAAKEISAPVAVTDSAPVPSGKGEQGDTGWVLWAILGVAVLFLTGITVWLLKSMGAKKE